MTPFMLGPGHCIYTGVPESRVIDTINGIVCEEEFVIDGIAVGYWAYGYYQPGTPWQGKWMDPIDLWIQDMLGRIAERIEIPTILWVLIKDLIIKTEK